MREANKTALKHGIGQRVRELRKAKGLKQEALTAMIGAKSHSTISELELGRRLPSSATLHALAAVFQVSVGYLLGDTDAEQSDSPETRALKASLRSELAKLQSCHDEMSRRIQRATALVEMHA